MKPHHVNNFSINKYKAVILFIAIVLSYILTVLFIPFFIFHKLCDLTMTWYYIAVSLFYAVFAGTLGFYLNRRHLKICKELKKYSKEIEYKNLALIHMYNELEKTKKNLDKFSEELEKKVFERTESIQNFLNNAGQGFLSFGIDLLVDKEYSLECTKIFSREINGENIAQLIFPDDFEMQELIKRVTYQVLNEKDESKREIYLSLLPNEVSIDQKQIHIQYKVISKSIYSETLAIMLILTDITDKYILQKQMENEKNILKTAVNIVKDYSDFVCYIKDYENFCHKRIFDMIKSSGNTEEAIIRIYRAIHTFKGTFAQLGLNNISSKLNQFENELTKQLKRKNDISLNDLEDNLSKHNLFEWINEDIDILKNTLGESFFKNCEIIEIDKQKLLELENKMLNILSPEDYNLIIPEVKKIRYKPFKELLKTYPNYTLSLADRFDKQINPFEIEGGDFLVDPHIYHSFAKSLGHIFRNIAEHGIESWEERIDAGKSESGNVKCLVNLADNKNTIILTIADDGRGIDIDLIKKTAAEKGFYAADELVGKDDNEVISLIFRDGFSTNCKISDLSGRGVGLCAVKEEVESLGGSVKVTTVPGIGTTFTFLLPYYESTVLPSISETESVKIVADITKNLFTGQLFSSYANSNYKVSKVESLELKEFSALIKVKGVINGIFILSAEKSLLETIRSYFNLESASSDEETVSAADVLAECANMIMGKFIKSISNTENCINFGTPIVLFSQKTKIKYAGTGMWTSLLEFDNGNIEINYINFIE